MAVAKCWDCGWEQKAETKEDAQRKARLHMALTPHLMVFGYSDEEFKSKHTETHKEREGR